MGRLPGWRLADEEAPPAGDRRAEALVGRPRREERSALSRSFESGTASQGMDATRDSRRIVVVRGIFVAFVVVVVAFVVVVFLGGNHSICP